MTIRIIVTELADADMAEILADIAGEAGYRTAKKYNFRFERLYDRVAIHPESCEARPKLGAHIRSCSRGGYNGVRNIANLAKLLDLRPNQSHELLRQLAVWPRKV